MTDLLRYIEALEPITSRVRTDVTALKANDKMIWTAQPLTQGRLVAHFEGKGARGVCPIKAGESTVKVALLDFDSHKGETPQSEMIAAAARVAERLSIDGLFAIAFRSSGGLGIHLFILWNEAQDAYSVRTALSGVLADCGFKNGAGGVIKDEVEIFPKQDRVEIGKWGSQFILPLAGKSEPLDLVTGIELGREHLLTMEWPISHSVSVAEKAIRSPKSPPSGELKKWIPFLYAIDPSELNYEEWLQQVGFALHYETQGGEEGLSVWDEWSSQSSKYTTPEYSREKWESIKDDKELNVTGQTLINLARARGYNADIADDFDDLPSDSQGHNETRTIAMHRKPRPAYKISKSGEFKPHASNIKLAIECADEIGITVTTDNFRDEIIYHSGDGKWNSFTDHDYTRIGYRLTKLGFKEVPFETIRRVVGEVADTNRCDTAIEWLESLPPWDGIPRIENFYVTYMAADNSPYTRAAGVYTWTAMAGRVLSPGCQADMVPILEGAQGVRKTSAVKAMVPHKELYCSVSFSENDDDLARKMRGRLIAEIGELKGLRSRELEAIKDFITRTDENWIPKYKEFGTTFPRRLIFIGTTNQTEFLADETGNRRWLPIHVEWCDTDSIARDRSQLWAEARERFKKSGVAFADAENLAGHVHEKYLDYDVWEETFLKWLEQTDDAGKPADRKYLRVSEVLIEAFFFDVKNIQKREEMRIGKILKKNGYRRDDLKLHGKTTKVWFRPVATLV